MKAISMKCTQEQFKSIKPKLIGLEDFSNNDFENFPYLTSPLNKNHWVNNHNKSTMVKTREVFETWDEKVFLEACGIETKPSIKEVKEYFKNAKEVECLGDKKKYNIENFNCFYYHDEANKDFNINVSLKDFPKHSSNFAWIYSPKLGYAKIISYKEPKFEITKETVLKYQMKDEFPECFDILKQTGWFKSKGIGNEKWLGYFIDDVFQYGFGADEKWFERGVCHGFNINKEFTYLAKPQEVQRALEKEAVKRGFKEGVLVKRTQEILTNHRSPYASLEVLIENDKFDFCLLDNSLTIDGRVIFIQGTWATIVPQYTQQEAEEKFNFKIV